MTYELHRGDVAEAYETWPTPDVIMSDGAYGVRGFVGDTVDAAGLVDWYRPHVEAWTRRAHAGSVLWFWNTEIGWATVHPLLAEAGWDYVQTVVWDKGIAHVAGNVNGKTIRRFPIVTEVAVLYQRRLELPSEGRMLPVQQWMRTEWQRAGIPLNRANEACGVKDAATRKYLTQDHLWYWPPAEMMQRLVDYANEHGHPEGWPYYSLDGTRPVTGKEWSTMRYRWNHVHGLTNVWQHGSLRSSERIKGGGERSAPRTHNPTEASAAHLNQKPLELMRRLINAVTVEDDVLWEPFGGTGTGSVAAVEGGRHAYAAEVQDRFADLAEFRLADAWERFRLGLTEHVGEQVE